MEEEMEEYKEEIVVKEIMILKDQDLLCQTETKEITKDPIIPIEMKKTDIRMILKRILIEEKEENINQLNFEVLY